MTRISIVIITFNSLEFINSCLASIFKQDCQDIEIIVVDNDSRDGTADFVRSNYPRVTLIENKRNLGPARARNQGIEIASGDWAITLDCDIVLEKNFFAEITGAIKISAPEVGMIQPKILNSDKKTIFSCGIYLSWLKRFYDIGKGKLDQGQFNKPAYIFGNCSATAVYRRETLEDIREETGYFDERFFFLAEDVDLAWRAQRKCWKALYYPGAISYHKGNSSSFNKLQRQFLCWRNRKLLLKKNKLNVFTLALIALIYDLPRLFSLFLFNPYVYNEIKNKRLNLSSDTHA